MHLHHRTLNAVCSCVPAHSSSRWSAFEEGRPSLFTRHSSLVTGLPRARVHARAAVSDAALESRSRMESDGTQTRWPESIPAAPHLSPPTVIIDP